MHYRSQLDFVAQRIEHRTRNAKVAGSIPSRGQVEFSTCPIWFEQYSYEISIYITHIPTSSNNSRKRNNSYPKIIHTKY